MIRDNIKNFLARVSDISFFGRNRSRIIIGTDRKNTRDSGYGDGGQNDVESSCVDLVAGFDPTSGDNDLKNDKSRIYIAEKTDPDDYFDISVGDSISGEPSVVNISDHIRIKGRKTIKIVGNQFSMIVDNNGNVKMDCQDLVISSPSLKLGSNNASEVPAWASKVLSELQSLQRSLNSIVGGATVPARFTIPYIAPTAINQIGATKTKIE